MKQFIYISGLPRSGSTLLCNILSQNPDFFVSKSTSGCHDVLFGIRNQWDTLVEHQAAGIDYGQLQNVLGSVLNSYHNTDKNIVIDKGRGWLSLIEMIEFITETKSKIIVPVRNISEILASFEKLWRKTTGKTQWAFEKEDYFKSQTVEGRCDIWSSASKPVGLAFNRVMDAINRSLKDRLLFLEIDDLTANPAPTMKTVYNFIEQSYFHHNFDNVEQVTFEDDIGVHRIEGLHTIRNKVEPVPHCAIDILGVELTKKYSNLEVWRK